MTTPSLVCSIPTVNSRWCYSSNAFGRFVLLWARNRNREVEKAEESMRVPRETCPQCRSTWVKRNRHIHTGNHNYRCKVCGRAFVLNPEHPVITEEQRTRIERLLLERISLRGICRAVGVGLQGLLQFMVARFQAAPEHL